MNLIELIENRKQVLNSIENLVEVGKTESRTLTPEEEQNIEELRKNITEIDVQIEEINKKSEEIKTIKTENKVRNMENFSDLIVRNGDKVENFSVRALVLSSGIDNVSVAGNISSVGYAPFYTQMGCEILPNLSGSIKLPYVGNIQAQKKGEGVRYDNDKTIATVLLQPNRFTVTETVGKEILSVANQAAFQNFLLEMVKGVDKAITKEVFDQVISTATAVTGLTAYTTNVVDSLVSEVDGDVTVLMPRAEFYKAKGTKVDTGSGLFLANKQGQFAGNFWDGTPLFYSNLFTGSTIAAADLKHVTIAEFGDSYEVIIDQTTKAPEGQVVITVVKLADVKVRNASAVTKATIA